MYSKFSQMADSLMAVLADWRSPFGHPLLTNGGYFSQIGGFSGKKIEFFRQIEFPRCNFQFNKELLDN